MKIGDHRLGRRRANACGAGFLKHGHEVTLGTREPAKLADWAAKNPGARVTAFVRWRRTSAKSSCSPSPARRRSMRSSSCGPQALAGKPVIDATNPIGGGPPVNGVLSLFHHHDQFADGAPSEGVPVRAFRQGVQFASARGRWSIRNSPWEGRPCSSRQRCGGEEQRRRNCCEQFGWDVEDMGPVEAARAIEPLCMLWCIPGVARNDWSPHAFKLLR